MIKSYDLPNERKMTAEFDENGIGKITVQALDSLVDELNYYAEQEPCDDAVSRQAVLEIAKQHTLTNDYLAIQNLPSVRPQETVTEFADRCRECGAKYGKLLKQVPKTGHWIYDETLGNWRCSKCNETPKTMGYVGTADFMAEHFKFCNHCGAKMVEPTCDTCEYNTAAFMPCNACEDKSEYKPQESE